MKSGAGRIEILALIVVVLSCLAATKTVLMDSEGCACKANFALVNEGTSEQRVEAVCASDLCGDETGNLCWNIIVPGTSNHYWCKCEDVDTDPSEYLDPGCQCLSGYIEYPNSDDKVKCLDPGTPCTFTCHLTPLKDIRETGPHDGCTCAAVNPW